MGLGIGRWLGHGNGSRPLPYSEYSDVAWGATAAGTWTGTIDPSDCADSLNASGPCPRCGHRSDETPVTAVLATGAAPAGAPETPDLSDEIADLGEREFTFECNCGGQHDGRGKNDAGCGAYWRMVAQWNERAPDPAPVRFLAGRAATTSDRTEFDELRQLDHSELDRVRTAADKWKTGLATLLALVAAVSVVKGRASFDTLGRDRQHLITILLALALALAGWATLAAMRAANGPLRRQEIGSDQQLRDLVRDEANTSLKKLRRARWLSVLSVVVLAVAVGIAWWPEEPTPGFVAVTKKSDGSIVCGAPAGADAMNVKVKVSGQVESIPLGDVKAVNLVQKC